MAIWGFNFVVIAVALEDLPPLLCNALRFTLAAVPAVFLVRRPAVPWRWVVAVALSLCVVKFSLLLFGIAAGMPAGLSSVVLQSQAIFTVLLAVLLLKERPGARQYAGLALAASGIILVAWRLGPQRPLGAFLLVVAAAAFWGLSNVATRRAGAADMLSFFVWVSAVAAPILIVLSLVVDGPATGLAALRTIDLRSAAALAYLAFVSTLVGWGVWGLLIRRYGASTVAPFSMLVPFFGIASAALFLREAVHPTDVIGGVLVVGGVLLGSLRRRTRPITGAPANAAVLSSSA